MKIFIKSIFIAGLVLAVTDFCHGQNVAIHDVKVLSAPACENQRITGTCWSFSGMSFFASEIERIGKFKNLNLSELFVVKNIYPLKAENYVRMHGKANFGEGGEFTDDLLCLSRFGLIPQEAYNGKQGLNYDHSSLVKGLDSIVSKAVGTQDELDLDWKSTFSAKLDDALGIIPAKFSFKGKEYTPMSFAQATGLVADDYILLGSFTHHPYYKQHVLEVPDNWNWERIYNVPLEDLSAVTLAALDKGYTVAWGADVSGDFNANAAVQRLKLVNGQESAVSAATKQQTFDNFQTQDDHAMHIIGYGLDDAGHQYFKVKNSWGRGIASGEYFYASLPYFDQNTISILVNKNALSKSLRKKLGIK